MVAAHHRTLRPSPLTQGTAHRFRGGIGAVNGLTLSDFLHRVKAIAVAGRRAYSRINQLGAIGLGITGRAVRFQRAARFVGGGTNVIKVVAAVFLVLHGLVHLLYLGQSAGLFELQPGLHWPDGSWALSRLLGDNGTRTLAGIFCLLAAAGFVLGAAGIFFGQAWWRTAAAVSAAFSGVLYLLFWNGRVERLDQQGGVGLLIDAAILIAVLVFRWPQFDF
jgi:hypothetical protein